MRYAVAFAIEANFEVIAGDLRFHEAAVRGALRHRVSPVMVDGQALAFQSGSFDVVLMSSLLQMVPSPVGLLAECRRVLRPDGALVITVPNHYQFIPTILRAPAAVRRAFGLPSTLDDLTSALDRRFGVFGPTGYYSYAELTQLLDAAGFEITEHAYAPGWLGSLIWEIGVLGSFRLGRLGFTLLLPAYPVARLYDCFWRSSTGSEHVVRAVKR